MNIHVCGESYALVHTKVLRKQAINIDYRISGSITFFKIRTKLSKLKVHILVKQVYVDTKVSKHTL